MNITINPLFENMTHSVDSVDLAVAAWHDAIKSFCQLQPHGDVKEGPRGTRAIVSGTPVSVLNAVISTTRTPDLAELREFAQSYSNNGLPWSIQLRGAAFEADIEPIAIHRGLTQSFVLPFMTRSLDAGVMNVPLPGAIDVRRVPPEDHDAYNRALASGYEAPEQVFRGFSAPNVLGAEGMTAWLVEEDGIAVATSFGVLVNDHVGVFNISTRPAYRRRGYARAATAAVLCDAYRQGTRTAFLHCTPAGRGVYESLGFATAETWKVYSTP
ncbi:GNAT family N-acetyltransferase [Paraburkholderia bannensis]|uniref:GNAT family N-acetyltransferase n=1 Tax=Paraburkholderia bannensis TaxID=765414 RepID=UPI002ABDC2EB|nr:GNAT family N-acetyltransferase [Paraburkholderia bannensis]